MFLAQTRRREIWIRPESAASGADKSGYPDPAAAGAEAKDPPGKVLAGFGRSTDGPLAGRRTTPMVMEVDVSEFAQLEALADKEDEDGHQLYQFGGACTSRSQGEGTDSCPAETPAKGHN